MSYDPAYSWATGQLGQHPFTRLNVLSQFEWATSHSVEGHCKPVIRGTKINGGWYYRWRCASE